MKRIILSGVFAALCVGSIAQKTWLGSGGNKLWSNGSNWSPSGVPISTDNVIINTSDSVEIDQAVNQNSITITNNAAVIFNTTTSRTITLSSTSTTQLGLLIDAGASLTVQGKITGTTAVSLTLALTGGIGVTGEIYGSLYFKSVGAGSGSSNTRLDTYTGPVAYAQLKVKSGGLIKYDDKSGNSTSAGSPTNSITMESGSTYWINKNGGSFPDGSWNAGSLCKSTGMVANGPSFNGTTYGNLEWNNPAQTAVYGFNKDLTFNSVTLTAANSNALRVKSGASASSFTLTINGDLQLASGVTLETSGTTVTAPNGGVIELKGNLTNNGTLTETGPSGTKDTLSLSGSSLQTISGTGTITNQLTLKVNNAAGVALSNALSLPYHLLLRAGKVTTTATNLLTLQSGCSLSTTASTGYTQLNAAGYTNYGSETAYIVGPVRKLGLSSATRWAFPVGNATQFRPVFLTSVTGDFTVEYTQASPRTDFGTTYGSGIDHISDIEYWTITGASSPSANVELSYYDPNSGGVTTLADLRVARYDGAQWVNEGNTATIGTPGTNGTVTSGTVTSYSPFTLASSTPANLLPLRSIELSFRNNNNLTELNWLVNADEDALTYMLEKSTDGRNFSAIYQIPARRSATATSYRYADVLNGRSYYRVKAELTGGRTLYSAVLTVLGRSETVAVYPNPARTQLQVLLSAAGGEVQVTDAMGRTVYRVRAIQNQVSIPVQQWQKGIYQLRITMNGEKMVKQFLVN